MAGYNFKNKKGVNKFLLDLSFAEKEGIGMWYEYLAKLRVYPAEVASKVLVCGLPEKYGVGVDNLLFLAQGAELNVIDNRQKKLDEFRKIAENFLGQNINLKILKIDDFSQTNFLDNSFDLVCSSEVLQGFSNYGDIIKEMVRVAKKQVIFFVSNKSCYAHPKYSGLNAYDFFETKSLIGNIKEAKIIDAGYIDIPPWPSGIQVSNNEKTQGNIIIELIKKVFIFLTPALVGLELIYPLLLKKRLAHFIYFKLEKRSDNE